ncbi:hypothetical protein D2T31_10850 [Sinirhodobacter populi]|uniref:Uncharacterized protein n=1 Tax=Paenirhodobacter populi TaxID=2306993 RepID=A0A443K9K3_9RHOB|nr:hypothetical protein [Sinirhodobacter populi]RWR29471.1 hypothetical protein D2T31_10850 [Sinirhodobacter populi]
MAMPDRIARAQLLWEALHGCEPEDALAVCAAFLDAHSTGGPEMAPFMEATASTAQFWADIAPPHELVAYGMAALDRLRTTALGLNTRKRLFVALWKTLSEEDRLRFVKRIDPDGMVIRRRND